MGVQDLDSLTEFILGLYTPLTCSREVLPVPWYQDPRLSGVPGVAVGEDTVVYGVSVRRSFGTRNVCVPDPLRSVRLTGVPVVWGTRSILSGGFREDLKLNKRTSNKSLKGTS